MSSRETQLPDLDALDAQSLKALVLAKQGEIESLKLLIVKLKRMHFGPSSEKRDRDIQQLELRLEDLESSQAAAEASSPVPATVAMNQQATHKPARRPLPGGTAARDRDHRSGSGSMSGLWRHLAAAG
jgi:transposase